MLTTAIYMNIGIFILLFGLASCAEYGKHDPNPIEGVCALILGIGLISLSMCAFEKDKVLPIWVFIPLALFIVFFVFITIGHEHKSEYMSNFRLLITKLSYLLIIPSVFIVFFSLYSTF